MKVKDVGPHGSDAFEEARQIELHEDLSDVRAQRENERSRERQGRAQLDELYDWLDHYANGNVYLAWYAQCRAKEMSHRDAIDDTVRHFMLEQYDWFRARQARRDGRPEPDAVPSSYARNSVPSAYDRAHGTGR